MKFIQNSRNVFPPTQTLWLIFLPATLIWENWLRRFNIQLRLLRKERHRYQQGDLELKEAITNISHDLRTPLTAINGYLDLLEREEKSETVHCYLSQIQNRTDVLKNLTEELFRYSVVTSFQELKPERMDVVRALGGKSAVFLCGHAGKGIQPESNCRRNRFSVNWMQVRSTVSFPTLSAMRWNTLTAICP